MSFQTADSGCVAERILEFSNRKYPERIGETAVPPTSPHPQNKGRGASTKGAYWEKLAVRAKAYIHEEDSFTSFHGTADVR